MSRYNVTEGEPLRGERRFIVDVPGDYDSPHHVFYDEGAETRALTCYSCPGLLRGQSHSCEHVGAVRRFLNRTEPTPKRPAPEPLPPSQPGVGSLPVRIRARYRAEIEARAVLAGMLPSEYVNMLVDAHIATTERGKGV